MNWFKKSQSINVMGEPMKMVSSNIVDGISYELYHGDQKAVIRVFDIDSNELVHLLKYDDHKKADLKYNETLQQLSS